MSDEIAMDRWRASDLADIAERKTTPTLDARAKADEYAKNFRFEGSPYVPISWQRTYDGDLLRDAVRQAFIAGTELLLPHLATATRADDGEAITEEWIERIEQRTSVPVDCASADSTHIPIGPDVYIVIESDLSVAIQQGLYDSTDSSYIAIPTQPRTRGDLRRLAAALGVKLEERQT